MDKQTYTLKGMGGAEVKLTLKTTSPGSPPPAETVQAWYDRHGQPKKGSCAVPGHPVCEVD